MGKEKLNNDLLEQCEINFRYYDILLNELWCQYDLFIDHGKQAIELDELRKLIIAVEEILCSKYWFMTKNDWDIVKPK